MVEECGHRILVVDDMPLIRKSLSAALVAEGYVVRTAVDGIDAIGKLRCTCIDLVISDLQMPRMSGLEFLAVVRHRFPQIPVIAISGEASPHGLPAGVAADLYFQKNTEGYEGLLQSVPELIRNPPKRAAATRIDSQPIWPKGDGDGHFDLACEDCLRFFKVLKSEKSARGQRVTTCPHCGGLVQFYVPEG